MSRKRQRHCWRWILWSCMCLAYFKVLVKQTFSCFFGKLSVVKKSMQVIINGLKHAKPPVWSFKSLKNYNTKCYRYKYFAQFTSLSLLLRSHKYKFLLQVCGLTILRAEKFLIGSSAASETELSMMNTRMRLVNMWWLISLWQNTRNLEDKGNSVSACPYVLSALSMMVSVSYGFVLLKMKKALPSGMGVIFSFLTSSEMTGRGPDGTSGSSSSAAVSSLSSSSSYSQAESVSVYLTPHTVKVSYCMIIKDTFSSFSSSFLSLQWTYIVLRIREFGHVKLSFFFTERQSRDQAVTLYCLLRLCWETLHLPSCPRR